jgi:tetratricopeptide (TPR) repeat protein
LSLESRKNVIEDPGAELLDKASGLWERFGRIALIVVVALAAVGVGTYYVMAGRERRENSAAEKLAQANDLFWRAEYDRSRQLALEVSRQYPGTPSGTDALRIAGDDAYWRGNWKDAITDYRAYLKKQGSGVLANTVKRSLAYALESDGQLAEATTLYDQLVGAFERETSGELLFAAARCLLAQGKTDEAKQRYQRILDEFPDSSYQAQARLELARLAPVFVN